MYTGIVDGCFEVLETRTCDGVASFRVALAKQLSRSLEIGSSVSIDGVCVTITRTDVDAIRFDVIRETMLRATLGALSPGDMVNVELSARRNDVIGGHEMSGHIDGVVEIVDIDHEGRNHIITFSFPATHSRYLFNKGFLGINGASLTTSDLDKANHLLRVHLIPETLRVTNLGLKGVGDCLNFEIDRRTQTIVDTVYDLWCATYGLGRVFSSPSSE